VHKHRMDGIHTNDINDMMIEKQFFFQQTAEARYGSGDGDDMINNAK
jgi:hypothetical protein